MKEPHHPQTYGPRWPRDRWISPTALNTYRNCAYRVRLAHIDRVPELPGYHVFLRKGRIACNILRDIAHLLKGAIPSLPPHSLFSANDADMLTVSHLVT
jgi:hypothetical protein